MASDMLAPKLIDDAASAGLMKKGKPVLGSKGWRL